jgi:hypothetical protein
MKSEIKKRYLEALPVMYPAIYTPGSHPLELANTAADNALAGKLKLEGAAWENAVKGVTGWNRWTMAQLAALPE